MPKGQPDLLKLLESLIEINSENPGGSEAEIAAFCVDLLSAHGVDVETKCAVPDRPNVIARLEGRSDRKIVFQSHLDTKPAYHAGASQDDWTRNPFHPTREGDVLFGLGACDTKGSAAAQLSAMIACARSWSGELPTLEWQGVADEENGSTFGAEYLLGTGALRANFAVVGEPTRARVSLHQMGSVWVNVAVVGAQCHGGMPWLGRDAVEAALQLIAQMKEAVTAIPRDPGMRHHPDVGIRMMNAGSHPGTVAGNCSFVSDIRVPPGHDRSDYLRLWDRAAAEIKQSLGVDVIITEVSGGGCEPHSLTDRGLLSEVGTAWTTTFEEPFAPEFFYGGTDARYFARAGTPAIVFGPGDLAQAHAPDEYVAIADVVNCEAFLRKIPSLILNGHVWE